MIGAAKWRVFRLCTLERVVHAVVGAALKPEKASEATRIDSIPMVQWADVCPASKIMTNCEANSSDSIFNRDSND